ncbi:mannosyltransferase putative-domain-containing protein [Colletotrichum navitas]|uniref:Mannosyltransferase putative-domain-containing protein n=1 Tax=Colletotrichum navitas TaxID=681940 RepID=A0AAD8Q2Z4_9PEZI|nr:mannosyltransferase putative-domain-containing protein [Colletotrichum navitas]KAK1594594.1 mannosyltransferase putative-domain-containing protein [Colletotrichum navitas]
MSRLSLSPRSGVQSTSVVAAAAIIALTIVYFFRFDGHITPLTSATFGFRASETPGPNLEAINATAQYFVDYPVGPPYKKVFGELGERTKVLRSWIEALEEKDGDGKLRVVGAERRFLDASIERVAASLFPYLQSPPRNAQTRTPLADLRRSFQSPGTPAWHPARQPRVGDGAHGEKTATEYTSLNAGIVIPVGRSTLRLACHLVASLTRVHRTTLPIQIAYAGDEDLPMEDRNTIIKAAAVGDNGHVEFLDVLTVFNDTTLRLMEDGWAIKPFAALGSRYEEVILLDADVVLLQPPEKLLQQQAYQRNGALLFHDRLLWKDQFPERDLWYHETFKHPSGEMQKSLMWTEKYAEEGDSGVVVLNKGRLDVLMGLLHICWQNTYEVRNAWTYRITYGDKETWWIGLEATGSAYSFSRHYGGVVGWQKPVESEEAGRMQVCSLAIAHVDETDGLLWYNGGLEMSKTGDPADFEVPTHWMIDQEWAKVDKKKDMSCMVGAGAQELSGHERGVLERSIKAAKDVDGRLDST